MDVAAFVHAVRVHGDGHLAGRVDDREGAEDGLHAAEELGGFGGGFLVGGLLEGDAGRRGGELVRRNRVGGRRRRWRWAFGGGGFEFRGWHCGDLDLICWFFVGVCYIWRC